MQDHNFDFSSVGSSHLSAGGGASGGVPSGLMGAALPLPLPLQPQMQAGLSLPSSTSSSTGLGGGVGVGGALGGVVGLQIGRPNINDGPPPLEPVPAQGAGDDAVTFAENEFFPPRLVPSHMAPQPRTLGERIDLQSLRSKIRAALGRERAGPYFDLLRKYVMAQLTKRELDVHAASLLKPMAWEDGPNASVGPDGTSTGAQPGIGGSRSSDFIVLHNLFIKSILHNAACSEGPPMPSSPDTSVAQFSSFPGAPSGASGQGTTAALSTGLSGPDSGFHATGETVMQDSRPAPTLVSHPGAVPGAPPPSSSSSSKSGKSRSQKSGKTGKSKREKKNKKNKKNRRRDGSGSSSSRSAPQQQAAAVVASRQALAEESSRQQAPGHHGAAAGPNTAGQATDVKRPLTAAERELFGSRPDLNPFPIVGEPRSRTLVRQRMLAIIADFAQTVQVPIVMQNWPPDSTPMPTRGASKTQDDEADDIEPMLSNVTNEAVYMVHEALLLHMRLVIERLAAAKGFAAASRPRSQYDSFYALGGTVLIQPDDTVDIMGSDGDEDMEPALKRRRRDARAVISRRDVDQLRRDRTSDVLLGENRYRLMERVSMLL